MRQQDNKDYVIMGILFITLLGLATAKVVEAFHRVNEIYVTLNQ